MRFRSRPHLIPELRAAWQPGGLDAVAKDLVLREPAKALRSLVVGLSALGVDQRNRSKEQAEGEETRRYPDSVAEAGSGARS